VLAMHRLSKALIFISLRKHNLLDEHFIDNLRLITPNKAVIFGKFIPIV
jgi:hypothetical protein